MVIRSQGSFSLKENKKIMKLNGSHENLNVISFETRNDLHEWLLENEKTSKLIQLLGKHGSVGGW